MTKSSAEHNQQSFSPVTVKNYPPNDPITSAPVNISSENVFKNTSQPNITIISASNSDIEEGRNIPTQIFNDSKESGSDEGTRLDVHHVPNINLTLPTNSTTLNSSWLHTTSQGDPQVLQNNSFLNITKNEKDAGSTHLLNSTIVAQNNTQVSLIRVGLIVTLASIVTAALIAFVYLVYKKLSAGGSRGNQRINSSILTRLHSGIGSLASSFRGNNRVYPCDDQSSVSGLVADISPEENCRVWASRSGNWSMQQRATVPFNNPYVEIVQHE